MDQNSDDNVDVKDKVSSSGLERFSVMGSICVYPISNMVSVGPNRKMGHKRHTAQRGRSTYRISAFRRNRWGVKTKRRFYDETRGCAKCRGELHGVKKSNRFAAKSFRENNASIL